MTTSGSLIGDYMPLLLDGAGVTLRLTGTAVAFGSVVGLVVGLAKTSRVWVIRVPAAGFVGLFRSIPILLLLFFTYYAVPLLLGVNVPQYAAAALALSAYCGAYLAEVVRGAVQAVPGGQREAAAALGMTRWSSMRFVVLPQAIRIGIPPAISIYVMTLKDSSLASVIGFVELTGVGLAVRETNAARGSFLILCVVAGMYFVMAYSLSLLGGYLERRLEPTQRRGGTSAPRGPRALEREGVVAG